VCPSRSVILFCCCYEFHSLIILRALIFSFFFLVRDYKNEKWTGERKKKLFYLLRMVTWASPNGFRFSSLKTYLVIFKARKLIPLIQPLRSRNFQIPVRHNAKLLGLQFYQNLSWTSHIELLKAKCTRALGILEYLSHPSKNCNRKTPTSTVQKASFALALIMEPYFIIWPLTQYSNYWTPVKLRLSGWRRGCVSYQPQSEFMCRSCRTSPFLQKNYTLQPHNDDITITPSSNLQLHF